jgi:acetylornithine deacetylase/succinyl-diaminopimelate desuccinylase-like protein
MPDPIQWKTATSETVRNLSSLIKANTTNPPGNEMLAIQIIQDILISEGFPENEITILESAPGRGNLVARLRGDGSQRPLLLSGHVDVVPVEREKWSHDPFGGEIIEGFVWGRGTLDMKGALAMYLEIFLLAFRQKLPLKRDLILVAVADEEAGFAHGSRFLAQQHPDLINAEYGMTEGGALTVYMGKVKAYPIQVAEKSVCQLCFHTRGTPGHGSIPHRDNAVLHLTRAIDRLCRARHLPVHITPTVKSMLSSVASQVKFPLNLLVKMVGNPLAMNLILSRLGGESSGLLTAMVSNTITPTMLKAGQKVNVIPSAAEANIDCRLLPGQTSEDVIREVKAITGPDIELEVTGRTNGAEFSTETPFYKCLVDATHTMDITGMIIPMLSTGATDASEYQRAGIKVYGFTPGILPQGFPIMGLAHGHDERVPISYIESGLPTLWQVINQFCV